MKASSTIADVNQATVNSSIRHQREVQRNDSAPSSSRYYPKQKVLRLSISKSFLPRSISPTKETEALQLAWDILNDKISYPFINESKTSSSNGDNHNNNISDDSMDEDTDTSDHNATSVSS